MEPVVAFYYRNGCHLCEDMWQLLREFQQDRPFQLDTVDIDLDDTLRDRYGTLVPVLAVGDHVICHYYLDPVALSRYLDNPSSAG
ncbi:MAG: glutaredoxin family protein [Sedimenticola sp.]|nr:glutaredoxin family protein [Sedimenticola sp.]